MSFILDKFSPEWEISSTGLLNGQAAFLYSIMGSRSRGWNTNTTFQDVNEYLNNTQDLLNTPTAGQTLFLNSTSVNDTAAGIGARTVRTVYLDAAGVQQIRTDTLNGTTAVNIGTGYTNIQWMEAASVGSASVSQGDVTISSINGVATVATTFSMMAAQGNRSLGGQYKVPTGYSAYLTDFTAASDGPAIQDVRLRITAFSDDRSLSSVYHFNSRIFLRSSGSNDFKPLHYVKCPAGSVIKISSKPSAAGVGNLLNAGFKCLVVKD